MDKKTIGYEVILIALMYVSVSATVINVPGAGALSIQAGVDSSSNGDTVLVAPGTYFENVIINGKYIVVSSWFLTTGDSVYITTTVIDGDSIAQTISIIGGLDTTMVLTGFTVQNGYGYGGGIVCNQSSPTITHNIIQNNRSSNYGGGIFCSQSSPIIESNTIISNSIAQGGGNFGGGICCFVNSHPRIADNIIESNIALWGGGIYMISSNPMITGNMIAFNQADSGAGIYCESSSPIIRNNEVIGNSANAYGGGMYFNQSNPVIQGNSIQDNYALLYGGGVYGMGNSVIELRYNTFCDNGVFFYGGAIYCDHCSLNVVNNTFHGNDANWGSGVAVQFTSSTIQNSIFAGQLNGSAIGVGSPTGIEISYCDFSNNVNGNFAGAFPPGIGVLSTTNYNGDSCDTYSNVFLDPLFVDTTNHDYHLTVESPCIDAGDPTSPLDPDGTIADLGAYYYHQTSSGMPNAVTDLTITCDSLNAYLVWSPVTTDTSGNPITVSQYVVYGSEDPFMIGDSIGFVVPPDTSFTDSNALLDVQRFYNVKARMDN